MFQRDLDVTFFHQTQKKHKGALQGLHRQYRLFAQMAAPHNTKTITQGDQTLLLGPESTIAQPQSYITRQKPDVIQVRGRDITESRTDQLHPARFQMDRCFCSFHSDVFNYKHMVHKR